MFLNLHLPIFLNSKPSHLYDNYGKCVKYTGSRTYSTNIYLFKVTIETTENDLKYVQSYH